MNNQVKRAPRVTDKYWAWSERVKNSQVIPADLTFEEAALADVVRGNTRTSPREAVMLARAIIQAGYTKDAP